MDPSGRTTREQRSDMRDDNTSTGGQWDNPMSKGSQGKWELGRHFGADTAGGRGGDTYGQQHLGQSGYEYGSSVGGGQTGTGTGGTDTQSDSRYTTSGQYGGSERARTGQTAGYTDPARNVAGAGTGGGRRPDDDDEYGAAVGPGGGSTGKPSMASRAMGAAEQMTGKIMGDQGKQSRGRERESDLGVKESCENKTKRARVTQARGVHAAPFLPQVASVYVIAIATIPSLSK
ncbi:hypothetical protein EDB87DRAFT_1579358 [Lactarius vividus]|nr:hypothetical protein EDB87DRAFT_1579358 [Lactarius vividus]